VPVPLCISRLRIRSISCRCYPHFQPAILALADGTVFRGYAIGAQGVTSGEVVFNTAMTGYQEILTDPSYCRQIVTLTYPTSAMSAAMRKTSSRAPILLPVWLSATCRLRAESWRLQETLPDYLKKHGIVAIAGIDTRKLTRILREKGAQAGCIMAVEVDEVKAVGEAQAFPGWPAWIWPRS
jgi:carbamoyl-phosphate synthase small subunit